MRAGRVPCIRLWLVSGQVWDAHIAQPTERTERPGELFLAKVAPGRASLLRTHNEPGLWAWNYCRQLHTPSSDQEKSGPRSSGDVTSSPGVHHVMSPSPGGPGDQIAETRTGNWLAPLSALLCVESK